MCNGTSVLSHPHGLCTCTPSLPYYLTYSTSCYTTVNPLLISPLNPSLNLTLHRARYSHKRLCLATLITRRWASTILRLMHIRDRVMSHKAGNICNPLSALSDTNISFLTKTYASTISHELNRHFNLQYIGIHRLEILNKIIF